MLRRIYVDNFKALRQFEVKLDGEVSLFAGANGSGKSSVLEAIDLFLLRRMWGANFLSWRPSLYAPVETRSNRQALELEFDDGGARIVYRIELQIDDEGMIWVDLELVERDGRALLEARAVNNDLVATIGAQSAVLRRDMLALAAVGATTPELARVRRLVSQLRAFGTNPWSLGHDERQPPRGLGDLSSFPAWYRYLSSAHPEIADRIQAHLRTAISGFSGFRFDEHGDPPVLRAVITQGTASVDLPFRLLSEGQIAMCALYGCLEALVDDDSVLFIDEPENFISSRELQPWLHALEARLDDIEEAGGHAQVVIVSHHPELLDQLARSNGIWFARAADGRVVTRPWNDAYPMLAPSEVVARGWADDDGGRGE